MTVLKKYWRYIVYAALIGVVAWPTSRTFLQQQLMRIGFFQPKFDKAQEDDLKTANTGVVDKATFVTEDGKIITTESLIGKVVFINFWATWCGPCIAEMPSIQVLYNAFKNNPNIVFLLVEVDGNRVGAKEFVHKQKLDLPIVYPNGDIPQNWLDSAIPSTVILSKSGKLAERKQGMYDYSGKGVQYYIQSLIDQ